MAIFVTKPQLSTLGESMMKYTFCDPCQEKCKVAINQSLTYQFRILFNLMINMNLLFEFMLMILKNHMFKVDLNIFLKNENKYFVIFWVAQRNKISFK